MKHMQAVVFVIGRESYAVPIDAVQEIVRVPEITAVPDAPRYLEGVINLRGRIVPVMDLRSRLRLPRLDRTRSSRALILQHSGSAMGLIVDAVQEVRKLPVDALEAPPDMIAAAGVAYITAVAKAGERLIIFLDMAAILSAHSLPAAEDAGYHTQPRMTA